MSFEDWTVEIVSVVPNVNAANNPRTGKPIDPDGITQSVVTMTLTHTSGKILHRTDVFSVPTQEEFIRYAQAIARVADINIASQADAGLIGALNIVPAAPVEPTQDQKDISAFYQADSLYEAEKAALEKLKEVVDAKTAEDIDQKIAALKADRDAKAAAAVAAKLGG